jgi:hypothetical protein
VFAEWKKDTPEIIEDCTEHDIKLMKLDRIIKDDETDKQGVIDMIRKLGKQLKNIFI